MKEHTKRHLSSNTSIDSLEDTTENRHISKKSFINLLSKYFKSLTKCKQSEYLSLDKVSVKYKYIKYNYKQYPFYK